MFRAGWVRVRGRPMVGIEKKHMLLDDGLNLILSRAGLVSLMNNP